MHLRTTLPLLLCTGCLVRDITRHIDQIHCSETAGGTTGGSTGDTDPGTTGCPDTDPAEDTTASATTLETTTSGASGTDSDSADASSSSSSESSGEVSSSTGEMPAVCGNGVIEASGDEPEECDDANDVADDGCSNCGRDRLVFVTSDNYQGGVFDGLGGADQRCRSLADQQDLPNFASFKAWLSDSKTSAKQRLFRGRGRYVLINGLVVADSWDGLLAGELKSPINVTETSETKNYRVWTGTMPDGSAAVGADHCADWTGMLLKDGAFWGLSNEISGEWTLADSMVDQPTDCSSELALYCFEQE